MKLKKTNYLKNFKVVYYKYLWWGWQIILLLASVFFVLFGVEILIQAYRLNDPFNFIMVFFASNLIILISLALMIGFVYRIVSVFRLMRKKNGKGDSDPSNADQENGEEKGD